MDQSQVIAQARASNDRHDHPNYEPDHSRTARRSLCNFRFVSILLHTAHLLDHSLNLLTVSTYGYGCYL